MFFFMADTLNDKYLGLRIPIRLFIAQSELHIIMSTERRSELNPILATRHPQHSKMNHLPLGTRFGSEIN